MPPMMVVNATPVLCWFCGEWADQYFQGCSLPSMINSDYRLELPQAGEFDSSAVGKGSLHVHICATCANAFRKECEQSPISQEYLAGQSLLHEEMSVVASDIAGGMLTTEDNQLRFGCWFGSFPMLAESRYFTGLTLIELFDLGMDVLQRFETTRMNLDKFLAVAPVDHSSLQLHSEQARDVFRRLTLSDDVLTSRDWLSLARSRVWILDATLLLDDLSAYAPLRPHQ